MNQLTLEYHARRTDPVTSHEAAETVHHFASEHCRLILGSLSLYGSQSIFQIADSTGLTHVQVARRMPEIGGIEVCGYGKSPSGRKCQVYRVANAELNGGEAVRSDGS